MAMEVPSKSGIKYSSKIMVNTVQNRLEISSQYPFHNFTLHPHIAIHVAYLSAR